VNWKWLLRPSLNWLLIMVPVAVVLRQFGPDRQVLSFAASATAIIPLAGWLGRATDQLASRTSEGLGGLLNATFGNAAELIITLVALNHGLYDVVKASITGSIIGNVLLVLGAAFLAGGLRYKVQKFNAFSARAHTTTLILAAIGLIVPAIFHHIPRVATPAREADLSMVISAVLIIVYVLSLIFTLSTHHQLLLPATKDPASAHSESRWSTGLSVAILAAATGLTAWISEILVATVEPAADALGMGHIFVGVVVVAIIGNAAEHSSAILMARKNRMDLAVSIAVGSSTQMAMFVAPVLVFASHYIGPASLDLVFTPLEIYAVVLSILIAGQVTGDGESHWLEGVQLISVYVIFGIAFFFLG
jgi:Ca2+:H+ antiporter